MTAALLERGKTGATDGEDVCHLVGRRAGFTACGLPIPDEPFCCAPGVGLDDCGRDPCMACEEVGT